MMLHLSQSEVNDILHIVQATRENLDRIEAALASNPPVAADDLDPGSPLNKDGQNLTRRGVEVCYRLFDMGKTRYAVSQALKISYGAATHRFHAWEKLGGKNREIRPLE